MSKKAIQKKRITGYFIDAAKQLLEKDGIESITVRNVADLAGYNSATMYNYFENIDHLVFFACMKYLNEYAINLQHYVKGSKNSFDKYLRIWKCFCHYSFQNPKIYYRLFFDRFSDSIGSALKEYYSLFPEELGDHPEKLLPMLLRHNIYDRNLAALEACVEEGFIKKEDIENINEMTLLIYQGMLLRIINQQVAYTNEEAVDRTLRYIEQTINSYRI